MSPRSQDSLLDLERFQARTHHTDRERSPDAPMQSQAEADFVAVGSAFWGRRESEPRPSSLHLSEGEDAIDGLQMAERANLLSDADAIISGGITPGRSSVTPTQNRPEGGSYVQLSDMAKVREERGRRSRRIRDHYRGPGSRSSTDTVERRRQASDTSNDDGAHDDDMDEADDRGRSVTPRRYFPQSYTPSHHSQQTEEELGEGHGPLSPDPWSSNFPYNARQRDRTEAIEDADNHFPVNH